MASYDSHTSLTHKMPKACHVASNQIFLSHNFFSFFGKFSQDRCLTKVMFYNQNELSRSLFDGPSQLYFAFGYK